MVAVEASRLSSRRRSLAKFTIAALLAVGVLLDRGAQAQELLASAPLPIDAPALVLPTVDGETYSLETDKGKLTLVNFWALWCAPCIVEMPSLSQLMAELKSDGLEIVAVNLGDEAQAIQAYLAETNLRPMTVLSDAASVTQSSWQVPGLPATFLVDGEGRITHLALGAREWNSAESKAWLRAKLSP